MEGNCFQGGSLELLGGHCIHFDASSSQEHACPEPSTPTIFCKSVRNIEVSTSTTESKRKSRRNIWEDKLSHARDRGSEYLRIQSIHLPHNFILKQETMTKLGEKHYSIFAVKAISFSTIIMRLITSWFNDIASYFNFGALRLCNSWFIEGRGDMK